LAQRFNFYEHNFKKQEIDNLYQTKRLTTEVHRV